MLSATAIRILKAHHQIARLAMLAGAIGALSGCAQLSAILNENKTTGEGSEQFLAVDKHSPYPAIRRAEFEQVNLSELWLAQEPEQLPRAAEEVRFLQ